MPDHTSIIRELSAERFTTIFSASSRKARQTYFARHGIRAPKTGGRLPKAGAKTEQRTAELFRVLQEKEDNEMADEILRSYLLTKRPMLKTALDHLGIPNDDGITESEDINKFEELSLKELKGLVAVLSEVATAEDIRVYLKYMGAKKVDEATR